MSEIAPEILERHPRAAAYLQAHPGLSLEQCLDLLDAEIKKLED